jgi:cyclohexanone monooxygenase
VVFQRTPNFTIPAWNKPLSVEDQNQWKANYAEHRAKARNTRSGILYEYSSRAGADVSAEEREQEYERRWLRGGANFTHAFNDIFLNKQSNDWAADFVRKQIKRIVKNPEVAQMLTPTDHPIGTKRICVDTDYYETFNLPHVKLVDVRKSPIQSISATQLHTQDQAHDLEMIVFATGFDAVTGAIERMNLSNPASQTIRETWKSGPRTYLGLMSHGFPNLFFITGPGSPSILTNVIVSIEQHVDLIARCLQHMKSKGHRRIEASNEAQEKWVQKVNDVANNTLFPLAQSWYMGANIPGKPRVFLPFVGGFGPYSQLCEEVIAQDYTGFNFS